MAQGLADRILAERRRRFIGRGLKVVGTSLKEVGNVNAKYGEGCGS